ncbi:MAG: ABC transporter ATP-binding protein [Deltaproteobacteria bacterium]|nr:MAG: ABC transporter ATP-binding protein [Deltaproteobacteria bacterium]
MEQGTGVGGNGVILKVENLHMSFGGVAALVGVSFEVQEGEIFSIIGPNGAGKTVMLNCINGLYKPDRGKIYFDGKEITRYSPHRRAQMGISRTFQKIELFSGMTVLDNIRLGRHIHLKSGIISGSIYVGKTAREEIEARKYIEEEIIDLLEIEHIRNKITGMLPYGLQKRVELARALALSPKIILLDEPMAGLNLEEVEDMVRFILDVNEEQRWKVTCVLVEHDMGVVMDISDRVMALNFGEKIAEGPPNVIQEHPEVIKAYLGEVEELYVTRR